MSCAANGKLLASRMDLAVHDPPPELHLRQRSFPPVDDACYVCAMVEDDEQSEDTCDTKEEWMITGTREVIQNDNADGD